MQNSHNALTDEKLAVLAQAGDDESMALLISAVAPIAKAKAAIHSNARIPDEDLSQEGMLGFLDAVRSFDPSRGVPFKAYAETCINNRILSAVRANFNNKNAALSNAVSLEFETHEMSDNRADPANILAEQYDSEHTEALLKSGLSDFEMQVTNLRLNGKSYQQIAEELSCTEKAVDNALQRIKKKFRSKLGK